MNLMHFADDAHDCGASASQRPPRGTDATVVVRSLRNVSTPVLFRFYLVWRARWSPRKS